MRPQSLADGTGYRSHAVSIAVVLRNGFEVFFQRAPPVYHAAGLRVIRALLGLSTAAPAARRLGVYDCKKCQAIRPARRHFTSRMARCRGAADTMRICKNGPRRYLLPFLFKVLMKAALIKRPLSRHRRDLFGAYD